MLKKISERLISYVKKKLGKPKRKNEVCDYNKEELNEEELNEEELERVAKICQVMVSHTFLVFDALTNDKF